MESSSEKARPFATTHWSVVLAAGQGGASNAQRALTSLCEIYWYPLYAFVRRKGHSPAEAQDLTQAFFAELLEKDRLRRADRQRGKFRSFLLASLKHFLTNQWRDAQTQKRGGDRAHFSLDFSAAESRYAHEPAHEMTPERIYERRWALTLLDNSLTALRTEYEREGKLELFEDLKDHLIGLAEAPYQAIAEKRGMSEGAVKVAAFRLRKRCRERLRTEIAETVTGPEEVDDEIRSLFTALES